MALLEFIRMATVEAGPEEPRWLLLIHQTPPKPDYLRVKIGRRLHRMGAVAIKNTVYALPRTDAALEDFQWLVKEILGLGGEATLCEARLVDGLNDQEVVALFNAARGADYAQLSEEAREVRRHATAATDGLGQLAKLGRRLEEVDGINFFKAAERAAAVAALKELEVLLGGPAASATASAAGHGYRRRTWVTRADVHVDRMACAWLIRRFIDPEGTFKFVPAKGYKPHTGELCFDMATGEFSHDGDQCAFEVLFTRFGLAEPGLWELACVIHDIDVKDGKFGRAEAPGIAALLTGIALLHDADEDRIALGGQLFDALLKGFAKSAARKRSD